MARMSRRFVPLAVVALVLVAAGGTHASVAAGDARPILSAMAQAAASCRDYTMTIVSQEWRGDDMAPTETILAKWARPLKIYYKRLTGPHVGREILFVDGWNDGKLKVSVHAWPVNFEVNVSPHGSLAMTGAKHPIDESSLIYLVDMVLENFRRADERGEARAEDLGPETVLDRPCRRIKVWSTQSITSYTLGHGETLWDVEKKFEAAIAPLLHENRDLGWSTPLDAKAGQTIRVPRYYAARIDLWIDDELLLPLKAEIYDGNGTLFERFEHHDLRVNVGLGPKDFSPDNPEYKF
jgi:outer membrane lipoprotein-sorting protein